MQWYDNSTYYRTIVTDFDLVCERAHLPTLSTTLFYFGSFVGNLLFGYIADRLQGAVVAVRY